MPVILLVLLFTIIGLLHAECSSAQDAEALYRERCAVCHEAGVPRAANRAGLSRLSRDNVLTALTTGSMREQGASLTTAQRDALAAFLGGSAATVAAAAPAGDCTKNDAAAFAKARRSWNGWSPDTTHRRFQVADVARLNARDVPRLKLKWAYGFPGINRAYSAPSIVGGRVFIGSADGNVYSIDAATGCTYWKFKASGPVRGAVSVAKIGQQWMAFFGDQGATAYGVDALSGKLVWNIEVDNHPVAMISGSPALADGVLYFPTSSAEEVTGAGAKYECCKFRGSVSAIEAATGKVIWKSYTIPEEPQPTRKNAQGTQLYGPSGAGVWSSPTIDTKAGRVYVTTGDSYSDPAAATSDAFVAFDLKTGKLLWWKQMTAGDAYNLACDLPPGINANCPEAKGPDVDFGASAMLVELGNRKRALIAGQKSGVVHAIDPDAEGEILWQRALGKGGKMGGIVWGSAADARYVYTALSDVQTGPVPPGEPGGQPTLFGIPLRLDPNAGGGLFALKLETGELAWQRPHPGCGGKPGCSPAQSAAVTAIPGVVFSGGLDGHLRAYSTESGEIVWDFDTVQEYQTVNGVKGTGGSIDGPGPVIVDGILYANSGYAYLGSAPGNVLLAFSVDGK